MRGGIGAVGGWQVDKGAFASFEPKISQNLG